MIGLVPGSKRRACVCCVGGWRVPVLFPVAGQEVLRRSPATCCFFLTRGPSASHGSHLLSFFSCSLSTTWWAFSRGWPGGKREKNEGVDAFPLQLCNRTPLRARQKNRHANRKMQRSLFCTLWGPFHTQAEEKRASKGPSPWRQEDLRRSHDPAGGSVEEERVSHLRTSLWAPPTHAVPCPTAPPTTARRACGDVGAADWRIAGPGRPPPDWAVGGPLDA